jgi:hypothetical protein
MWLKRVIYHYDAGDLELVQQLEEKNPRTREFSPAANISTCHRLFN